MGSGRQRAAAAASPTPHPPPPRPRRHSWPPTVIPAPFSVIPAQAGTHAHPNPHPSPLLEGRLGGGGTPRVSASPLLHPDRLPRPPHTPNRHSCAPNRHSCAGRNPRAPQHRRTPQHPSPPPSPIHPSPLLGGRLGGGWDATSRRHPPSHTPLTHAASSPPSFPRKNDGKVPDMPEE